jgi:rhodanese-related sulfurtransferase
MLKSVLKETVIILMVVIPLALLANSLRPDGLDLFNIKAPVFHQVEAHDSVRSIPLESAIEKYRSGKALFVDTRSPEEYLTGHISGALNLPDYLFDEYIDDFLSRVDTNMKIITYCDGEGCQLGFNVAEKLYQLGFERVFYLTNGWGGWQENSLPTDREGDQRHHEE